ncbi:MAG: nucleoside triphosphate pyrophosphohydrolase [Myxococcota bacterium]
MTSAPHLPQTGFERLVVVMERLRAAEGGCPWDREQTLASLRTYLVEESYELLDAMDALGQASKALPPDLPWQGPQDEREALAFARKVELFREELGDVLLQIAFQSQIAKEAGWFDAQDVARGIADKMIRRHPHVFQGVGDPDLRPAEIVTQWEQIKRREGKGALDGVPRNLPSLLRAQRIGEKAGRIGLDWPGPDAVLDKVDEELAELRAAMASGDEQAMADELGDVLFALSSLARHLGVDAEQGLRGTLDRFTRRFKHVEHALEAQHGREYRADLDELDALWQQAKAAERSDEPTR